MTMLDTARDLIAKFEVLRDFEDTVRDLMAAHEEKRPLWFPHDLIGPGARRVHQGAPRKAPAAAPRAFRCRPVPPWRSTS